MTTFIYALKEPDTGEIRYIGKSDNPQKRLQSHLTCKSNCHRVDWIRGLAKRGLKPIVETVDEVEVNEWPMIEAAYIQFYREEGFSLVNSTDGGESGPDLTGIKKSEETRKRMSEAATGRKLSPDHLEKLLAGRRRTPAWNKGKKLSEEEKAVHPNRGKSFSEERKQNISRAKVGFRHSLESRQQMSESRMGNQVSRGLIHSVEHIQKRVRASRITKNRKSWENLVWVFV